MVELGMNGGVGINTTGLGGVDLTNSGFTDAFFFEILDFDAALEITVAVYDMTGGVSTYSEVLASLVDPVDTTIRLST